MVLALAMHTPALAQSNGLRDATQGMGIEAVVGEHAISTYDVENRIRFIIATTQLSNTPDVVERIRPQVIRSLIDERLQLQEAERNNITITAQEVNQAIGLIEQQRQIPPGAIDHILQENRIPSDTFTHQIRAQLAWNRVMMLKIRPYVRVTEEEIALAGKRFTAAPAPVSLNEDLEIGIISLPVEKASKEAETRQLADKLTNEIRMGANFEELARQFSSTGKVDTFWVSPRQLDPAIAKVLAGAKAGFVSEPARTADGFTIVKVYHTRSNGTAPASAPPATELEVTLKEILLKLKPEASAKEADILLQIGEDVSKYPGTCTEKGIASIDNLQDFDIEVAFRTTLLSQLPPALKIIAEGLKIGDISTPFASAEGIRLYMLCDKKEAQAKAPDREQVSTVLLQQKMALEAQKYLRNLRRDAFIEIREP